MKNTNTQELRKILVLNSVIDLLVLQLIKEEPIPRSRIVAQINSKFDVSLNPDSVSSVISSLQNKEFILTDNEGILRLTKKGKLARQKLVEEYLKLQRMIKTNLQ